MHKTAGSARVISTRWQGRLWLGVTLSTAALGVMLWGKPLARGGAFDVHPDPVAQTAVSRYLSSFSEEQIHQGIWLQTERAVLAHHQGMVPLPVASLTKIATSLAALHAWGPTYQFMTLVSTTGPIREGVLYGDLVVQGGADPFFVTEDAIELRQQLWQMGLRRVTGKLVITGDFFMNFSTNPELAGTLFKRMLQGEREEQVRVMKGKRGKVRTVVIREPGGPGVAIAGPMQVMDTPLTRQIPLIRHRSLPLAQILKRMNVYSNNAMANMLTEALGGPHRMVWEASQAAAVSFEELHLINGSGLGQENQLSARTVCALLVGIHNALRPARLTIADVFPVSGHDRGTIRGRHLPLAAVVKTGTLRNVSTLAGVMFTRAHGPVWFALINQGNNIVGFREQQDAFLQMLTQEWGPLEPPPADFLPSGDRLGAARNDILSMSR